MLVDAFLAQASSTKLKTFVSASAVGYYGFHEDEVIDERAKPGDDFLATVTREWEHEAKRIEELPGARAVFLRTGMVLGRGGGAVEKMLPVFKRGLGGRLGSGQQWMSWIHIEDLVDLYVLALENGDTRGAINGTAPHPVTNLEFTETLAKVLNVSAIFKVPAFSLKILFGEMSDILLKGQRVVPKAALALGFKFKFADLEAALRDIVGDPRGG